MTQKENAHYKKESLEAKIMDVNLSICQLLDVSDI